MAEVVIRAFAPVYAHVEVDEEGKGEVTKVVVGDEDVDYEKAEVIEVLDVEETGEALAAANDAALAIYRDPSQQWPGWKFGY